MSGTVGIIGLGLMGTHIAQRFADQGYEVVGYDTDPQQLGLLRSTGGSPSAGIQELAQLVDVVVLSLPNGSVSHDVCLGPEGIIAGPGARRPLIIETTTARPSEAVHLAKQLTVRGFSFLDVGLSGSGPMIAKGTGLGVVGGPGTTYRSAAAVLKVLCGEAVHVGEYGAGMTAKLVINLVLYINRIALAEGLILAEHSGVPTDLMLRALQGSAARSTAMEMWGERMVTRRYDDPTSRIRQHIKDVHQIMELADSAQLQLVGLPLVAMVAETAIASGMQDSDNSVVIEVLRKLSAFEYPPVQTTDKIRSI